MFRCIFIFMMVSVLLSGYSGRGFATDQVYYNAEVGWCKKAVTDKDRKKSQHLFFSIVDGQRMWSELGQLRLNKQSVSLINTRLELKEEKLELWKLQFDAAERVAKKQQKYALQLKLFLDKIKKENVNLKKVSQQWEEKALRYKREKVTCLVTGVVAGGVFVAVVSVVIAVLSFLK